MFWKVDEIETVSMMIKTERPKFTLVWKIRSSALLTMSFSLVLISYWSIVRMYQVTDKITMHITNTFLIEMLLLPFSPLKLSSSQQKICSLLFSYLFSFARLYFHICFISRFYFHICIRGCYRSLLGIPQFIRLMKNIGHSLIRKVRPS